jgi:hypothetical protein
VICCNSALDSEGGSILSNAELGKLMRNSAKSNAGRNSNLRNYNQQQQQQLAAATRNLYNKQQQLQYAPSQNNRRQYGSNDFSGYSPLGAAASNGQANNDDDDNEGGNFGGNSNFGSNFDSNDNDGEGGSQADGQPMNLNQAASGYPGQGDYNEGFNFGGAAGYGPSSAEAGADFGMGDGFGAGEGRRAKSASSLMGSRNVGDDDAGAPQFGPNSAVNSGDGDDEGRSGYSPDGNDDDE